MNLSEFLNEGLVATPLGAQTKTEAISGLVDLVAASGLTTSREQLLAAVLAREAQRTTGVGQGFAVPHAKCDSVTKLVVAFGRPATPVDFGSIDGKPVRLVALLATPTTETSRHLQALAALLRIVTQESVYANLLSAPDAKSFIEIIRQYEASL